MIGVGGLGITGTVVLAWDSNREIRSGSFFSITMPSGTSLCPRSSLTRAVVS